MFVGLVDNFFNFVFFVFGVEVMFVVCMFDFDCKYFIEVLCVVVEYCGIVLVEIY